MKFLKKEYSKEKGFGSIATIFSVDTAVSASIAITTIAGGIAPQAPVNVDGEGFCITSHWADNPEINSIRCSTDEIGKATDGDGNPIEEIPEPGIPEEVPEEVPEIDNREMLVTTWNTTLASKCEDITLPIYGKKNISIDWGDGTKVDDITEDRPTHSYASKPGERVIVVKGNFRSWGGSFDFWEDAECITKVNSWGETGTSDLSYGFAKANNLESINEIPASTTNMSSFMRKSTANPTLGELNTSNVDDMSAMFIDTTTFDRPLSFTDTSNVRNMENMFLTAHSFNQPVKLNTSSVRDMSSMFAYTKNFDNVLEFSDLSQVEDMADMFRSTVKFNQPIDFDTPNLITMNGMFSNATIFNSPVKINTENVTEMITVFSSTKFNSSLQFSDTSKVTNMSSMFYNASDFDQNISGWNTEAVTTMEGMFYNARRFNKDLSGWDDSKVINFNEFANGTGNWRLPKPPSYASYIRK